MVGALGFKSWRLLLCAAGSSFGFVLRAVGWIFSVGIVSLECNEMEWG